MKLVNIYINLSALLRHTRLKSSTKDNIFELVRLQCLESSADHGYKGCEMRAYNNDSLILRHIHNSRQSKEILVLHSRSIASMTTIISLSFSCSLISSSVSLKGLNIFGTMIFGSRCEPSTGKSCSSSSNIR